MKAKTIVLLLMALSIIITACIPSKKEPNYQQKSFIFEVTDADGNVTAKTISTTEATVGDALVKEGLIEGETSDMGLMVSHVNGIRADFMEDGAWWALYVGGEMAMVGVAPINIEEGETYAFVYTPA